MKKFIVGLAAMAGLVLPAGAMAAPASKFFQPAIKANGITMQIRPRLITVTTNGVTARYAVTRWGHYGHLTATALATGYVQGKSVPLALAFHSPARIPVQGGAWWVFTRMNVVLVEDHGKTLSTPDKTYNRWFEQIGK